MLFYIFRNQTERRDFGSSAFIEIQYCKLADKTSTKAIVDVRNIRHWQDDSLYISDDNRFYAEYGHIFDCGTYNNLKTGAVDLY